MISAFFHEHWTDHGGMPAGGISDGRGFAISWQNGPLGRGEDRKGANGAFVETILKVVEGRINFYQEACDGRFACDENEEALHHIRQALKALDSRTQRRESEGTEGTHAVKRKG